MGGRPRRACYGVVHGPHRQQLLLGAQRHAHRRLLHLCRPHLRHREAREGVVVTGLLRAVGLHHPCGIACVRDASKRTCGGVHFSCAAAECGSMRIAGTRSKRCDVPASGRPGAAHLAQPRHAMLRIRKVGHIIRPDSHAAELWMAAGGELRGGSWQELGCGGGGGGGNGGGNLRQEREAQLRGLAPCVHTHLGTGVMSREYWAAATPAVAARGGSTQCGGVCDFLKAT